MTVKPDPGDAQPSPPEAVEALNARLESFIRLALDARCGLKAAEALCAERLSGWTSGKLGGQACWQQLKCDVADCPAHGKSAQRCWLQVGTLCGGEVQGDVARKIGSCYQCPVLRNILADPQRALGENALILAHQLETLTTSLHRLAVRDPLTGLRNRHFLEEMAPPLLSAAERRDATPWLLCIDLDGFKQINDRFGHQAGDEALVQAAGLIEGSVRAADIVFRTGGDEFVVLLQEGSPEESAEVAHRLHEAFDRWNRDPSFQRRYRLAASIGRGPLDPKLGLSGSLEQADQNMYAEKRGKHAPGM